MLPFLPTTTDVKLPKEIQVFNIIIIKPYCVLWWISIRKLILPESKTYYKVIVNECVISAEIDK